MGFLDYLPVIITFSHCALAHFLRTKFSSKFSPKKSIIFQEFICTMEISCVCAELVFVKTIQGNLAFIFALFLVNFWWNGCFGSNSANPVGPLLEIIYNKGDVMEASYRFIGQLLAVPLAIRYSKVIWCLGLLKEHKEMYKQEICQSDIQTWFIVAAVVEFLITFADASAGKLCERYSHHVSRALYSASGAILVFIAFNLSGGYFNPILASALTFGCSGSTYKEHLLVYWIAAILGAVASKEFFKFQQAKKVDKSKKKE